MMSVVAWPEGFMWGTGASSTQCDGAAPASDWWAWELEGRAPVSGDGNGFAERYREDFGLLAGLGLTHHRLSIEWARVEPAPGEHDAAAVDHYRRVLAAAHEAGITPWVCLHHFTLPRWFADAGGFLVDATGQALFDPLDPASCLARATDPFLRPATADEQVGQVANVCFAQALVLFHDRWHLYHGMADSRIGCATAPTAADAPAS